LPFTLTVDMPNLGDEGTVFIHGLGTFGNGTHEITDDQEQNFRIVNSHDEGGTDSDPESDTFGVYLSKVVEGPSLTDAAESMYGITVTSGANKSGSDNKSGGLGGTATKTSSTPTVISPVGSQSSGAPSDDGGGS
jgi:hypothetical protein